MRSNCLRTDSHLVLPNFCRKKFRTHRQKCWHRWASKTSILSIEYNYYYYYLDSRQPILIFHFGVHRLVSECTVTVTGKSASLLTTPLDRQMTTVRRSFNIFFFPIVLICLIFSCRLYSALLTMIIYDYLDSLYESLFQRIGAGLFQFDRNQTNRPDENIILESISVSSRSAPLLH